MSFWNFPYSDVRLELFSWCWTVQLRFGDFWLQSCLFAPGVLPPFDLYTFQSRSNDSFGELHSSPVIKRWGNDSRESPILLFSPQLGPGDAGLDETFWLQKNSLQLLSQEHQRSVISLRGRLRCWRSVCSLAVIRDSASSHWNQGSEMRWGDCWSQNASARSTKGNFTKWNRVAGYSVENKKNKSGQNHFLFIYLIKNTIKTNIVNYHYKIFYSFYDRYDNFFNTFHTFPKLLTQLAQCPSV